jgi:2-amino-4-hydroxy-6-hydroxymethyldihydropteridine diphosphokinase
VGLGANLGDPEANLRKALQAMAGLPGVRLAAWSPVYRTQPQGLREQPWFRNQVAALECAPDLSPHALARGLFAMEAAMGRVRNGPRFGPRLLDLDLLLFGGLVLDEPDLTIPHPRMRERAFVLVPLRDVAPDMVFPDGQPLADAIAKIPFQVHNMSIRQ